MKEESTNWNKIISNLFMRTLIYLVVAILIIILVVYWLLHASIYVMPKWIIHNVMPMYGNDTTMAQMHVDTAGNLLIFYVSFASVIITMILVIQSGEANKQSKKAVI